MFPVGFAIPLLADACTCVGCLFVVSVHTTQTASTNGRINEEGIKSPTGNTSQATYTPSKLLLILRSSLKMKQDKYTEANRIEEKKNEKDNEID